MNIVWDSNQSCVGSGYLKENSLQPQLTGVLSGYGWLERVHPPSGQTYWWILPSINTSIFNRVLADFARYVGAGKDKRILLALDQAGWHISQELEVPQGIPKRVYAFPFTRITTG
jgi:hypothetical protein